MNLESISVNNLLSVTALSLLVFVTVSVVYLSFVEFLDSRRRNK